MNEYFICSETSPFAMHVVKVRDEWAKKPGITHADQTGRIQTVSKITNQRYHMLIEAFMLPVVEVQTSPNERTNHITKEAQGVSPTMDNLYSTTLKTMTLI